MKYEMITSILNNWFSCLRARQICRLALGLLVVAMVLSVLPGAAIAAEDNLFEEDTAKPKVQGDAGIDVPKTPQARQLAMEIMDKTGKAFYDLAAQGVKAFEASYVVKRDDATIGTISSTGDLAVPDIKSTFNAATDTGNDWLANAVTQALTQALTCQSSDDGIYAVKSGDKYIISDFSALSERVKVRLFIISEDLLTQRFISGYADGRTWELLCVGAQVDGKAYLKHLTSIDTPAEGPAHTQESKVVWVKKGEIPFVKRLVIQDSDENNKGIWSVELDDVSFTKGTVPATTAAGAAPAADTAPAVDAAPAVKSPADSLDWDDVSREVVAGLLDHSADMTWILRNVQAVSCTIDISSVFQGTTPMTAKLNYSWQDTNNDGQLDDSEITVDVVSVSAPAMRLGIKDVVTQLRTEAKNETIMSFRNAKLRGEKKGDGYMVVVHRKDGQTMGLAVTGDFRIGLITGTTDDGGETSMACAYQAFGDRWAATDLKLETTGNVPSVVRITMTNEDIDGIVLPARMNMVTTADLPTGQMQFQQSRAWRNWKLTKRQVVLPSPFAGIQKIAGDDKAADAQQQQPTRNPGDTALPDDPEVNRLMDELVQLEIGKASDEEKQPIIDAIAKRVVAINVAKMKESADKHAADTGDKASTPQGRSVEDAVIITAANGTAGIAAEHQWLSNKFGKENEDWKLTSQTLIDKGDKMYDEMTIELADGTSQVIYFDINSFFGK